MTYRKLGLREVGRLVPGDHLLERGSSEQCEMNQDLWKTVWEVSQQAQSLPVPARSEFIRANCPDPEAAAEVEGLLAEPSVDLSDQQHDPASPQPLFAIGSRIGRYTITGLLGRGAMGDTFRAHDEELDRSVAVKVLRSWPGQETAHEHSLREARAASVLNHPNIVMVFEVLQVDSASAIVMEMVKGRTLRHWCSPAQSAAKVAHFGRQLALALAAAHAAGIIHRDVKPENAVVRDDGYLKLLDFGLAHYPSGSVPTVGTAGTFRYMSPEQARAQCVNAATDVFSLGIVLFELATGTHPFGGNSDLETLSNIASGNPAELSLLHSPITASLKDLIGQMLANSPQDRPKASDVAERLATLVDSPPVPARNWLWPGFVVFVCLLVIVAAIAASKLRSKEPAELPEFYQFTRFSEDRHVTSAAVSPDGRKIVFSDVGGSVRLVDVHGSGNQLITQFSNAQTDLMSWIGQTGKMLLNTLDLSQDSLAFQLVVLDSKTGARTILPVSGTRARPSHDGRRLAYLSPDRSEVWVSDIDGRNPRRLVADRPGSLNWLEWSVNSRRIHYFGAERAVGPTWLWRGHRWRTIDVETGAVVGEQSTENMWPGFMTSNGRLFLIGSEKGLWEVSFDERGHFQQPPTLLSNQSLTDCCSASADGRLIAAIHFSWGRDTIHAADTQPSKASIKNIRRVTSEASDATFPRAWMPDNQGVLFESKGPRDTHFQIYWQHLNGKMPVRLSPSEEDQLRPSVSPDGRWVLFLSGTGGEQRQAYIKRAPIAGGVAQNVPTGGPVLDFACAYKAHRCVVREIQQGSQAVFFELDPVRGKGRELTRLAFTDWAFGDWSLSPDGTRVVFADTSKAPAVLRIVYLDQPPLEKTVRVEGSPPMGLPVWNASGDAWYLPTQNFQIRLIGLDGRNRFVHNVGYYAVPSPDGRKLAFLDHPRDQNVWILER